MAAERVSVEDIASGLSYHMIQIKGLSDLIADTQKTFHLGFPVDIAAGIDAIRMIAEKAVNEYAKAL